MQLLFFQLTGNEFSKKNSFFKYRENFGFRFYVKGEFIELLELISRHLHCWHKYQCRKINTFYHEGLQEFLLMKPEIWLYKTSWFCVCYVRGWGPYLNPAISVLETALADAAMPKTPWAWWASKLVQKYLSLCFGPPPRIEFFSSLH